MTMASENVIAILGLAEAFAWTNSDEALTIERRPLATGRTVLLMTFSSQTRRSWRK